MRADTSAKEKGFAPVVLGAEVKALHAIFDAVSAGHCQNRHARFASAEMPQSGKAFHRRQL